MKNYHKNLIKNRLAYCLEWKSSIDNYLTYKEIFKKTDKEYCKTRPLLKIILNIYFLPYNLLKLIKYLQIRHEYKKMKLK